MISPQDVFPAIAPWVAQLDDTFPGAQIKPYFAQWEVLHILSLALLGGASILLNLRLIGSGLTDESPSVVRRGVLPWLNLGVVGVIVTGILIGTSNPERLYTSEAFTAKMLGLAAALFLTYGVSLPAAKAEGRLSRGAGLAAAVGLGLFGLALGVFAVAKLVNPGLWHVIIAAALIVLFVTRGVTRFVYLAGLLALIASQFALHHAIYKPDDYAHLDPANKVLILVYLAWILAIAAIQIVRSGRGSEGAGPAVKALAYAAILVWVTTAAAGRWIAFA
ncbi:MULTISPECIES: DUF6644 family protein [unclassified Phenylobacterium]|uniref:DUF6644 family protein n=1 Tax=unclassified Phenylobacterium TaxID=2640670 RepID=UPI00083A1FC8|nr:MULTISPECIES: DUF6644 family protein [unclassified Phenylobacterium]